MFLCGAGASIDGGLADAFTLTENVYQRLRDSHDRDASKVFGLVVAKVIARKVRDGGSPFERVNVEEVYDGIERLAGRNSDILSDFVTGWDPALGSLRKVSERDIAKAFEAILNSAQADNFSRGRIRLGMGAPRQFQELLTKLSDQSFGDSVGPVKDSLLRALVGSLQHNEEKIAYFHDILRISKSNGADLATLNYDLIAERSADAVGFKYDYGLGRWNDEKIVKFARSSPTNIRILKLHGSLNWFARDDDIEISEPEPSRWSAIPNLVFGGAGNKLRIDGPFLQLRHEFQTRLLQTNILVIIGYSFQDEHLNSIIRRWTSTRRKGKLVVVNPSPVGTFAHAIGSPYKREDKGKIGDLTVDLVHIQAGAADAVERLRKVLDEDINLRREDKNGALPHIHFRNVD